jgi:hypothetical protein
VKARGSGEGLDVPCHGRDGTGIGQLAGDAFIAQQTPDVVVVPCDREATFGLDGSSTGPHLHIDTPSGRRCPQALLYGLWRGWPVPTIAGLRTTGCTYTAVAPPPQSPVPVPPDLPLP